jgi:copper transport protein
VRRAVLIAFALVVVAPASALAHSAFLGSSPEPGTRLGSSPREVSLTFTEPLNRKLSTASLVGVADGRRLAAAVDVSGRRVVLRPTRPLSLGAYRVEWHTVSTDDGHALEGSFSFGVRAAAAGGEHSVQQSPFARDGWLRVVARGAMYATLLVFSGALLLDALLSRAGRAWLVPEALSASVPTLDRGRVERRYRRVVLDAGFLAAGASAFSAVADATDAAGGFSAREMSEFLLSAGAGLTRLYVVGFVLLGVALAAMRFRAAGAAALGALALSGHANAASPRGLAVINDWAHLSATALWLGGIALIVVVWGSVMRRGARRQRLAVARHVLPRFGRVALPAFVAVVVTGLVSAAIELGRLQGVQPR